MLDSPSSTCQTCLRTLASARRPSASLVMPLNLQAEVLMLSIPPCLLCQGMSLGHRLHMRLLVLPSTGQSSTCQSCLRTLALVRRPSAPWGAPGRVQPQPLGQARVLVGPEGGQEAGPDAEQREVQRHAGAVLRARAEK